MAHRKFLYLTVILAVLGVVAFAQTQKKEKDASPGPPNLQSTLEARERAGWEAFKNRDKAAFTTLVTEDYAAGLANGKGLHDLNAALAFMDEVTLESYTLSDFKLKTLGPRTALLTYHASFRYKMGNTPAQDAKLYVSDLWVKRGGQWKSLHYQETELK